MQNTKISITHYGLTHTTEVPNDAGIDEIIDAFCLIVETAGWTKGTVEYGILEKAGAIEYERNPSGSLVVNEDKEE